MTVRRYRPEDHRAVYELHQDALRNTGSHRGPGAWDDDLHSVESAYLESGGEFLVGVVGDRVVAMGGLRHRSPERAEIKRMRVHPAFQRRGFGRTVLHLLEARAAELGFHTLELDTTVQQVAAQALYRSEGYRERGRGRLGPFEVVYFYKQLPDRRAAEAEPAA